MPRPPHHRPRDTHALAAIVLVGLFVLTLACVVSLYTQTWHWLLAAAIFVVVLAVVAAGVDGWVRLLYRRTPSWQCSTCGYDRRGLPPGQTCPECGKRA
jgi:peptidoglycan/LPS O-acetylase OafA/YrhL